MVIFPILKLTKSKFIINRLEKFGGRIEYYNFDDFKEDFLNKKLFPSDLKLGIIQWLVNFLEPLRNYFKKDKMIDILEKSYQ